MDFTGFDARLVDRLRHLLPSAYRLEDEVLSTRHFSSDTLIRRGPFERGFYDQQDCMLSPVTTLLHAIFPERYPELRGNDSEILPDGHPDRENALERFLRKKECEVAAFLKGFESRLSLAATDAETRYVLDEFVRVTHLPPEVAEYFYQRARQEHIAEKHPHFDAHARVEVDRNFCYAWGDDFLIELRRSEAEHRLSRTKTAPSLQLDTMIRDGMLLEAAQEAYRRQEATFERQDTREGFILMENTAVDLSGFEPRDLFTDMYTGISLLSRMSSGTHGYPGFSQMRDELFQKYKLFTRRIFEDLFIFTKYAQMYVYCCHKTNDADALHEIVERCLEVIAASQTQRCAYTEQEGVDTQLLENVFHAWHARKMVEPTPDIDLDNRVAAIGAAVADHIRTQYLPMIRHTEVSSLEYSTAATLALKYAMIISDHELEETILTALAERGRVPPLVRVHIYELLSHYFPDREGTLIREQNSLLEATYAYNRLPKDELRHWQQRLTEKAHTLKSARHLLRRFLNYHEIHQRKAKRALAAGDILTARIQDTFNGEERQYVACAYDALRRFTKRSAQTQRNLIESCTPLIDEDNPGTIALQSQLKEQMIALLRKSRHRQRALDEELFSGCMRTARRLKFHEVLEEGGHYIRALHRPLYPWVRDYWPIDSAHELPETLAAALSEEAQSHLEQRSYGTAYHIYKRLDPRNGTHNFLAAAYTSRISGVTQTDHATRLTFIDSEGKEVVVTIEAEPLRGRAAIDIYRHSLIVEHSHAPVKGKRVIVTKRNGDERISQIEYKVLQQLERSGVPVARPLSCIGDEITVEYAGETLANYAQSDQRDTKQLEELVKRALNLRNTISDHLVWILNDDDKQYLQNRRLTTLQEHFNNGLTLEEIERDFYALRIMRSLGFYDEKFTEAYMKSVGAALQTLPNRYRRWIKDNAAGNIAIQGNVVVSFDFNNIVHDVVALDDSRLVHAYGLNLPHDVEEACCALVQQHIDPEMPERYAHAYSVAGVHRNLLQAGNIIREIMAGKNRSASRNEVIHYVARYNDCATRVQRSPLFCEYAAQFGIAKEIVGEQIRAYSGSG